MVALSVLLRVFLSFPPTGTTRYDLGFLPIAATGAMLGPVWSGIAYVLADIIGTVLSAQVPFFPITVCKFLFGFIMGAFFYKKELSLIRCFVCALCVCAAVDMVCMPFALYPLYGKGILAIMLSRIPQVGIMLPVRTFAVYLMGKHLGKYIKKYSE